MSLASANRQMGSADPLHASLRIPVSGWWMALTAVGVSAALAALPRLATDAILIIRIAALYLSNHQG